MIAQLDKEQVRLRPFRAATRIISHVLLQGRPLTTKGRWLNHLLLLQFAILKKLPKVKTVKKPIFILGIGRSGTTILGKILALHPYLCFLNEPKAMWHSIYSAEDLIGSYSRGPVTYRLSEQDAVQETIDAAHNLYSYALAITHSQRILDKYPELIFRIPFIKAIFPDAKLLFLVRNGWDTIQSITTWSQNKGVNVNGEQHDWWGANQRKWNTLIHDIVATNSQLAKDLDSIKNFTQQSDMAAIEWIVTMREGLNYLKSNPHDMLKIHYEQFVTEPKNSLIQIFDFCELPQDQILLDYAQRKLIFRPAKEPFPLHPAIVTHFQTVMDQLGYVPRLVQ